MSSLQLLPYITHSKIISQKSNNINIFENSDTKTLKCECSQCDVLKLNHSEGKIRGLVVFLRYRIEQEIYDLELLLIESENIPLLCQSHQGRNNNVARIIDSRL